jgi:hypothetical protein
LIRISTQTVIALTFAIALGVAPFASAQTSPGPKVSIALESDILSYFIKGYSGIVNVSLRNGFQVAGGIGRYDLPEFLVKGDANYDLAQWKATATSLQVFRAGYRFRGPMKSGPALTAVVLNQNLRLRSSPLGGETRFRQVGMGGGGGYYFHVGQHFYIYPTVAVTHNTVASGEPKIGGVSYKVEKISASESVHVGWEWGM